jgi:hypothetical protein
MTILYPASKSVKSARPFGLGIIASVPAFVSDDESRGPITDRPQRPDRLPSGPSEADRPWAAYELNKDCHDYEVVTTAEDRHFDAMAEAAAFTAAHEAGSCHA